MESPTSKRICTNVTPDAIKSDYVTRRRRNSKAQRHLFQEPSETEEFSVVISNLPNIKPFPERALISTVEKTLEKLQCDPKSIKHCYKYDSKKNSILVQFQSEHSAKTFASVGTMNFQKYYELKVEEFNIYKEETIWDDMDDDMDDDEGEQSFLGNDRSNLVTSTPLRSSQTVTRIAVSTGNVDDNATRKAETKQVEQMMKVCSPFREKITPSQAPSTSPAHISLEREEIPVPNESKTATAQVKICNLPREYDIGALKYALHQTLWMSGKVPKPLKPITNCTKLAENEAMVTFDSVENAKLASDLLLFELDDQFPSIHQQYESREGTDQVEISGLHGDFDCGALTYALHQALYRSGDVIKPMKPILNCCKMQDTVALITFDSVEHAKSASNLKNFEFEDCRPQLRQVYVSKELTAEVAISKLPKDFDAGALRYAIHYALWTSGGVVKPLKPVVQCTKVAESEALVKFDSVEHATQACKLINFEFEDTFPTLQQKCNQGNISDVAASSAGTSCTAPQDEAGAPIVQKQYLQSLDSKQAELAFLQECVALETRKPFHATTENLKIVVKQLKDNHNIIVSVEDCSIKKKRLDEGHRRNPTGYKYAKYMAFLRGETNKRPSMSEVHEPYSMEDDIIAGVTFTKGAVMPPDALKNLVDVWCGFREEYWSVHKDTRFYKKISAEMILRGFIFSPSQCQSKMGDLTSDFKSYTQALKRTGQGAPQPWPLYEPLRPILEGRVHVEAQLTYGAGAAVGSSSNKFLEPSGVCRGNGKERPPAAKAETRDLLKLLVESRRQTNENIKELRLIAEGKGQRDGNNNK